MKPEPDEALKSICRRRIFTTGQAAKICQTAPRTIAKWMDSGKLLGYRIPGSQDRRVPRENLVRFLRDNGMPLGPLAGDLQPCTVLLIACGDLHERLLPLLPAEDYAILHAWDAFEAGVMAAAREPDCVVIDHSIGIQTAYTIVARIKTAQPGTVAIEILNEDDISETTALRLRNPVNPGDVAEIIEGIQGGPS